METITINTKKQEHARDKDTAVHKDMIDGQGNIDPSKICSEVNLLTTE